MQWEAMNLAIRTVNRQCKYIVFLTVPSSLRTLPSESISDSSRSLLCHLN